MQVRAPLCAANEVEAQMRDYKYPNFLQAESWCVSNLHQAARWSLYQLH